MGNIIRAKEVVRRTGLSRTTIWRQVRVGAFPAPLELTENTIGWDEDEVSIWLASRSRASWAPQSEPELAEAV